MEGHCLQKCAYSVWITCEAAPKEDMSTDDGPHEHHRKDKVLICTKEADVFGLGQDVKEKLRAPNEI